MATSLPQRGAGVVQLLEKGPLYHRVKEKKWGIWEIERRKMSSIMADIGEGLKEVGVGNVHYWGDGCYNILWLKFNYEQCCNCVSLGD